MPDVTHNTARRRFEAATEGGTAVAYYTRDGDTVTFTHTEVPEAAEGKGVGSALARAALAWARGEGLGVVPMCPFFAAYMARHPDTLDLVGPEARKWLDPDYDEPRHEGPKQRR
jgi:uncharacterized protein